MPRYTYVVCVLLLFLSSKNMCEAEESSTFGDVTKYFGYAGNVIKFGKEVYNGVNDIINMLKPKTSKESESDIKINPGMEQRITDQIKHVSKKLDSLKVNMQNVKEEIIDKILNEMPDIIFLKNNLFDIYLRMNQIENLYQNFVSYVKSPTQFRNATLMDFAKHATSHDLNELPNVLKTIHWMLVQTDVNAGESILSLLSRSTQVPKHMCKRQQSLQQMLLSLYNNIVLADIKGHAMIQVSYKIIQFLQGGTVTGEVELAEQQFINRITNTMKSVKAAMKSASRSVWTCDLYGYKEGLTYTKLNNVFQKYIINEADINKDGTCTATCPDYKRTRVHDCYEGKICAEQRACDGELWNCEYKIGSTMWICPSDRNASRRYEYIEYGNSQRYGLKGTCQKPSVEMYSWTRGTVECSYCMCTCDDKYYENSDRYVNLRLATSDFFTRNYAVTGVKFEKVNHILHIKIQHGKLLPNGVIDQNTVEWKPIEAYRFDETIPDTKDTEFESFPVDGLHYHTLEYKVHDKTTPHYANVLVRKAAVNLDDVDFASEEASKNYVVVGLKFGVKIVKGSGYHLYLEALMAEFNFTTGEIDPTRNFWHSADKNELGFERSVSKSDRVEVNIANLDVPTYAGAAAIPNSQTNQFLYFTTSSLETDAGQNTIPFIDLQPVETYPAVPLSGAGIFHKSSPGSGGFLALKLFTYNYEPHFQTYINALGDENESRRAPIRDPTTQI